MQEITKHTLFVGLNDKDIKQQLVATNQAKYIIASCVDQVGYEGCTITESTGFYRHNDGSRVVETSLQVVVLFADDVKTKKLIDDIKIQLNQESIALQIETITSGLI